MIRKLKDRYTRFNTWKKTPYEVAPMSDSEHECTSCATLYKGNFCPRCGQSAKIEQRMSLWKTFLLFLDVWGMGNRGMFRTLRDLILRPGYLICDYIRGKRSAYFPPFKLLFLLTALSVIVSRGYNLAHENYNHNYDSKVEISAQNYENKEYQRILDQGANKFWDLNEQYPGLARVGIMMFMSFFFYPFFKNSKLIGKLSFHEFIIAMIYLACMGNLYAIPLKFFGVKESWIALTYLLYMIPLRQITEKSRLQVLWRYIVAWIWMIASIILLYLIIAIAVIVCYHIFIAS